MAKVSIEIDDNSGFCFGVVNAIKKAEEALQEHNQLYCLGSIVHNAEEVNRLGKLGMQTIDHQAFAELQGGTVLFRAHGEPPSSYTFDQKFKIIDATCPVVLKLQQRIKKSYQQQKENHGQVVIYGKKNHAEVIGLVGQTENTAIIVLDKKDIEQIDFDRPIELYSQTTMPLDDLHSIATIIKSQAKSGFIFHDTVCRQMSNRVPRIRTFVQSKDVVVFVCGKESSNGKVLFGVCDKANENTYLVHNSEMINKEWFEGACSIGVCGATSTPRWQMEEVADVINGMVNS